MADQLQLRGGTTAEHSSFTGALREITVDIDKDTVVVHDNTTVGGHPLAKENLSNVSAATTAAKLANQKVAFNGGAAAAPSVTFNGDTNTGIYSPGADQLAISTSGFERIRIGANGQIGLSGANYGTSGQVLTSAGSGNAPTWTTPNNSSVEGGLTVGSTNAEDHDASVYFNVFPSQDPAIYIRSYAGNLAPVPMAFKTGLFTSEACRIDEGGRLLIGTSYANTAFYGNTRTPKIQLDDNVSQGGMASIVDRSNNIGGTLILGAGYYSPPSVDAEVGALSFQTEDDEGKFLETASIKSFIDGTVGIDEMPGRLVFSTTADGASSPTARATIDSSGRLLVGTSTARADFQQTQIGNPLFSALHQIEGAATTTSRVTSQVYGKSNASGPAFVFAKHRGNSIGGHDITAPGDVLGEISFQGSDGTKFIEGVNIKATHYYDSNYSDTDYLQGALTISVRDGHTSTPHIEIARGGQVDFWSPNRYVSLTSASGALLEGYNNGNGFRGGTTGYSSFFILSTGDIFNQNGVYSSFSDIKLKENIVDAGSQWDDLKALRVRKYNLKKGETHTQIGLIAQEVELVSPGLVKDIHDRDKDGNELDTVTKGVKYSVLYMKAIKALQEAMERIETLEAKVAALEGL